MDDREEEDTLADSGCGSNQLGGTSSTSTPAAKSTKKRPRISDEITSPVTTHHSKLVKALQTYSGRLVCLETEKNEERRIKGLYRLKMSYDLAFALLKQTDELLDATLEILNSETNSDNQSSPENSQSRNISYKKKIAAPITTEICEFEACVKTFVLSCEHEIIKNFKNKNKMEKLKEYKDHIKGVMKSLDNCSDMLMKYEKPWSASNFERLPTAQILLSLSKKEQEIIKTIRNCRSASTNIEEISKKHKSCTNMFCKGEPAPGFNEQI